MLREQLRRGVATQPASGTSRAPSKCCGSASPMRMASKAQIGFAGRFADTSEPLRAFSNIVGEEIRIRTGFALDLECPPGSRLVNMTADRQQARDQAIVPMALGAMYFGTRVDDRTSLELLGKSSRQAGH